MASRDRDSDGPERLLAIARMEVVDSTVAAVLRGRSGAERLRMAHEAWELAQCRLRAFLSARHPGLSAEAIQRLVAQRFLGDAG